MYPRQEEAVIFQKQFQNERNTKSSSRIFKRMVTEEACILQHRWEILVLNPDLGTNPIQRPVLDQVFCAMYPRKGEPHTKCKILNTDGSGTVLAYQMIRYASTCNDREPMPYFCSVADPDPGSGAFLTHILVWVKILIICKLAQTFFFISSTIK